MYGVQNQSRVKISASIINPLLSTGIFSLMENEGEKKCNFPPFLP